MLNAAPDAGLLRPVGLALAATTAAVHLALAAISLRRGCRRYGDLLHGLCLHAALVGCLQAGLVVALHALLHSSDRHDQPLWRGCCKVYLFCRIFLPGLYQYLTAAITVCFRNIRYPPRRCGKSCTRLGYLTAHCLPWAACSAGLLPVLLMHKDGTEAALRTQGRCLLIERWAWLGPLSVLHGAPLLTHLMLTCLLCAYKPYRSGDSDKDSQRGDDAAYNEHSSEEYDVELAAEIDYDDEEEVDECDARSAGSRRSRAERRSTAASRGVGSNSDRNGNGRNAINANSSHNGLRPQTRVVRGSDGSGRYYCNTRLLRGRPMRLARSFLLAISLLQACTQLPYCITAMLQTVLRNLHSRQLIQQPAIDALYWLHLAHFPLAGLLLTAFVLQIHRAFRITEADIEKELQAGSRDQPAAKEVLQTTSMLTSL